MSNFEFYRNNLLSKESEVLAKETLSTKGETNRIVEKSLAWSFYFDDPSVMFEVLYNLEERFSTYPEHLRIDERNIYETADGWLYSKSIEEHFQSLKEALEYYNNILVCSVSEE